MSKDKDRDSDLNFLKPVKDTPSYVRGYEPVSNLGKSLYRQRYWAPSGWWETADGRRFRIRDMHKKHLLNTIKLLRSRVEMVRYYFIDQVDKEVWFLQVEEGLDSIDVRQYVYEIEEIKNAPWEDLVGPKYWELYNEARRRGSSHEEIEAFSTGKGEGGGIERSTN